jgi:hypothetical protein
MRLQILKRADEKGRQRDKQFHEVLSRAENNEPRGVLYQGIGFGKRARIKVKM